MQSPPFPRYLTPRSSKIFSSTPYIYIYICAGSSTILSARKNYYFICFSGPGSSVGIATGYGLDGPGIESRWGAKFSAPVQTSPGAHPASCTMDTGSFPGVKRGRNVTLIPYPLPVPWTRKSRGIPLLPLRAIRPAQGCTLPLPLYLPYH